MHHFFCEMSSVLRSVNLILLTLLLVHLILRISPQYSHGFCFHYLSFPQLFAPDLKLISFTNTFLHSLSGFFWTAFSDLNLFRRKRALAFVCFNFFLYFLFLATCARLSWPHSAVDSTLNFSIVAYRTVWHKIQRNNVRQAREISELDCSHSLVLLWFTTTLYVNRQIL